MEATDTHNADSRAENIGIYFDGVDRNMDCACCGDRWRRSDDMFSQDEKPASGILHALDGSIEMLTERNNGP